MQELLPPKANAASALFAASATSVTSASVVITPTDGLVCGDVAIDCNGFPMPAYFAKPAGIEKPPVVLVLPEIFGLHAHIADVTRRLARCGYMAVAADVMARQGDARNYSDMPTLMAELVSRVPDEQVLNDADAIVQWAGAQGGDLSRLGVTGFCWGGRMTWLYAAHQSLVKAGVAWYGRLAGPVSAHTPRHPVDVVGKMLSPVLGLYGAADAGIPLETVATMQRALEEGSTAARASRFVVYPDAPHAFYADYRPSFRAAPAQAAWLEMLDWFGQHGV